MDELAQRREARRRKILENSQNRLERITGVEQKASRDVSCENNCVNEKFEAENVVDSPSERVTNEENEFQPLHNNNSQPRQPPKQYRTIVVISLAIFVNMQLLIFENYFKVDITASHLNKIFLPLLIYEVIDFLSEKDRKESKNFLYLLLVANAKNSHILPLIKHIDLITSVLQDVMIYFFVYVLCDVFRKITLSIFS